MHVWEWQVKVPTHIIVIIRFTFLGHGDIKPIIMATAKATAEGLVRHVDLVSIDEAQLVRAALLLLSEFVLHRALKISE